MGEDGINISAMQVGETDTEKTNLMVLTNDNDLPASTLEKVKAVDGILDAKLVNFYAV
jgi:D-3-phosphoglycerate dehydrogenase